MIAFFSAVISDSVILIMLSSQEMFREIIPLGVEENLIKDDISQQHNSSLLNCTPPWLEGVKSFLILVKQVLVEKLPISNSDRALQFLIVYCLVLVFKFYCVLCPLASIDCKEDCIQEMVYSSIVFDNNLINSCGATGSKIMVLS
jgi:hypothetical protein